MYVHVNTYHIIYYVSHLSWCYIPPGQVTGAISMISASDKSLPGWVICTSNRERERLLALKTKH